MRVIAGKFRSQTLQVPRGWKTRPTSDRLRETLFNILAPRVEGSRFADLFAGTGAVGIEALSRGAHEAYFAETAKPALAALRKNLNRLGLDATAQVDSDGALPLLRRLVRQGVHLDLVFLDPPYRDHTAYETTVQFLADQAILNVDAVVIAEHSRREPLALHPLMRPYRTIEQGEAALTFLRLVHRQTE